jgi:hypothetical protein
MLHEFLTTYHDAIIARTREKLVARPWPSASASDDSGVCAVGNSAVQRRRVSSQNPTRIDPSRVAESAFLRACSAGIASKAKS